MNSVKGFYLKHILPLKFILLDQNYKDFDECSALKHPDCYYRDGVKDRFQYTYFCGTASECYFYNYRPALQVSKSYS